MLSFHVNIFKHLFIYVVSIIFKPIVSLSSLMSSTSRLDSYLNALNKVLRIFLYPLYNNTQQKMKLESLTFTWTQKHTHTQKHNKNKQESSTYSSSFDAYC